MGLISRLLGRSPVDLEERGPDTGVKYKDMLVLEQLVHAGADLTAPRHVLYYLYFKSHEAADAAGREADAQGFDVAVHQLDGATEWTLKCERHDYTLSLDIVRDNTDYFEELAAGHSGDYDGWEASV